MPLAGIQCGDKKYMNMKQLEAAGEGASVAADLYLAPFQSRFKLDIRIMVEVMKE